MRALLLSLMISSPAAFALNCQLAVTTNAHGTQIEPWKSISNSGPETHFNGRVRGGAGSYVVTSKLSTDTGSYVVDITRSGVPIASGAGVLGGDVNGNVAAFVSDDPQLTVISVTCGANIP